ncbi:aspartate ammonia-lyase [Tissierella creatinophila]|uniref:Aspartate ammonia-lyase n=1 Tax=Tissierella creatinophila DSM 6911 TaxID=1123403 RepID=A0A1U7M6L7_TISCR|nr:aspartate ammonia-lyase [Tissierella creatinophila]OLS02926.1 aspartate ammonia-lyase [Tissierella creatinophila DSM 6911]
MGSNDFRIESDSVGEKNVPKEAYYGLQSLRAAENFYITGKGMYKEQIIALAEIKKAAAMANNKAGLLTDEVAEAIIKASDEIIEGELHDEFICDPIQGGAGTSANMNANEIIANRANEILGGELGVYDRVHPNDHVNMGQSTNDVFPTSGKLATLKLIPKTLEELEKLYESLMKKSHEFDSVIKMGRTQMQDAVPIRLGQEFHAYASVIKRDIERIKVAFEALRIVNMGASAIGTGINVDTTYFKDIVPMISKVSGIELKQAEDLIDATQNLDGFVHASSSLKTLSVNLSKISNDLRLMSSGPRTGFAEINLPAKQNGSSIMPGKINPVIPEVMSQVAFNVIGNDMTITMAAEGGQLELNAFEPVIFYNLFESIVTLTNGVKTFRENCIDGITANRERAKQLVHNSVGIITAIVPHVGYKASAKIADKAIMTGESVRNLVIKEGLLTEKELNEILDEFAMTKPGIAAKHLLNE